MFLEIRSMDASQSAALKIQASDGQQIAASTLAQLCNKNVSDGCVPKNTRILVKVSNNQVFLSTRGSLFECTIYVSGPEMRVEMGVGHIASLRLGETGKIILPHIGQVHFTVQEGEPQSTGEVV